MFVARVRSTKGYVLAVVMSAVALSVAAVPPAGAIDPPPPDIITYTDFTDLSAFRLNGSAASIGNPVSFGGQKVLRLTNALSQGGSAFLNDPITLADNASFSTTFSFQITDPIGCVDTDGIRGADGLVFVVQTVSSSVGGAGGGIGYAGIGRSVGVEFDTWNNGGGDANNGNHVGIDLNGSLNSVALAPVSPPMNNGAIWHAWVDYDGGTGSLEARVSTTSSRPALPTVSYVVNLPSVLGQTDAFVGFTSGTGCAGGDHDIRSWTFLNIFAPLATGGSISGRVTDTAGPPNPVPGALLQVCLEGFSACSTTASNASGDYIATGLPDGLYRVKAFPPAGSRLIPTERVGLRLAGGLPITGADIEMPGPIVVPPDITITNRHFTADGTPVVHWMDDLVLEKFDRCPGGIATYKITSGTVLIRSGPMAETPSGSGDYRATISPLRPAHGPALITITIVCPQVGTAPPLPPSSDGIDNDGDGRIDEEPVNALDDDGDGSVDEDTHLCGDGLDNDSDARIDEEAYDLFDNDGDGRIDEDTHCLDVQLFNIYIDPSGTVVDQDGDPIAGATVTLYRADDAGGPFSAVPDGSAIMSPSNRTNPDTTDPDGEFAWDVIAGFYVVRAEATDCHQPGNPSQPYSETPVLTVPPPAVNLVIVLECPSSDTTPPELTLPAGVVAEATGPDGAAVVFPAPTAFDDVDGPIVPVCSAASGDTFPVGDNAVTCTATDAAGNSTTDSFIVSVVDTTGPTLVIKATPNSIWPPNHKMVEVRIEIVALDLVSAAPIVVLDSVVSNEPDDAPGGGDGKTVNDIQGATPGASDFVFSVRAERQGGGSGRIYTATYTATDEAGNSTTASVEIRVPHDKGKKK